GTSAACSPWPTAPAPACTSSSSPAKPRKRGVTTTTTMMATTMTATMVMAMVMATTTGSCADENEDSVHRARHLRAGGGLGGTGHRDRRPGDVAMHPRQPDTGSANQ